LRGVLTEYVVYFNQARPHQGIQQRIPSQEELAAPASCSDGRVIPFPVLGGLHHDYRWAA
ncbi:MAG: integrase, partial [Chloroflexota bacterium]|nr:integrase [Chloroflexota bacterium]